MFQCFKCLLSVNYSLWNIQLIKSLDWTRFRSHWPPTITWRAIGPIRRQQRHVTESYQEIKVHMNNSATQTLTRCTLTRIHDKIIFCHWNIFVQLLPRDSERLWQSLRSEDHPGGESHWDDLGGRPHPGDSRNMLKNRGTQALFSSEFFKEASGRVRGSPWWWSGSILWRRCRLKMINSLNISQTNWPNPSCMQFMFWII